MAVSGKNVKRKTIIDKIYVVSMLFLAIGPVFFYKFTVKLCIFLKF